MDVAESENSLKELFTYVFVHGSSDKDSKWNKTAPLMQVMNK